MTKVANLVCLLLPLALGPVAWAAQPSPAEIAADEATRRQEAVILLRRTLDEAQQTQTAGDVAGAARLYEEAYRWVQAIGVGIDNETQEAVSGLSSTRLSLARSGAAPQRFQRSRVAHQPGVDGKSARRGRIAAEEGERPGAGRSGRSFAEPGDHRAGAGGPRPEAAGGHACSEWQDCFTRWAAFPRPRPS
jgi:hypothetical protein